MNEFYAEYTGHFSDNLVERAQDNKTCCLCIQLSTFLNTAMEGRREATKKTQNIWGIEDEADSENDDWNVKHLVVTEINLFTAGLEKWCNRSLQAT